MRGRGKKKNHDKGFNITEEEVKGWTDITAPLIKEWDEVAKEYYCDADQDQISVITYGHRVTLPLNWVPVKVDWRKNREGLGFRSSHQDLLSNALKKWS